MTFFQEIKKPICLHPARQESLFCMIQGLCLYQSVSLRQLAYAIRGAASLESKIRRIQRFFQHQVFDYSALGKAILILFKLPEKITLTLDRTEWMFGKKPINFMVLGFINGDMSIPFAFDN